MTDRDFLIAEFGRRYDGLRSRLARKFGSVELAEDAMQETYVRLARKQVLEEIRNYESYFFFIARNAAIDLKRSSSRLASAQQINEAMGLADSAPNPEEVTADRGDWRLLKEIIHELPARQRLVLAQARLEGKSCREIAEDLKVSKRTIEMDLKKALDFCSHHFAGDRPQDFASAHLGSSSVEKTLKGHRDA